ncbi:MAG: large subunit ribosomal protein [Solirubrobacterales bacterium]|jgi:large subunit ribosomal protein L9|nr:large subunit ribosomal protein [Solirubrobacterales bacterium]MDX6652207.1 large subunit ribosomal protein [Solirubrobacterales bacterium]MDX6663361.1 large subunit ribosomal protein [Solirubrobacterales bacterium]
MAQAILLKDVADLGSAGQAVDVSPGYLRNYLVPRKLAQAATQGALEEAQRRHEAAEKARAEQEERAAETAALLSKTVLTISQRAGEDGKLFGSVGTKEIAEAINDARGMKIDRKRIRLDQPIHEIGTYMVEIEVAGGSTARVKTIVAEAK